ncbi:leucine-rich repeat-containing protein 15-like [Culicoides brevitarsis]|uniref:leucine-rich repeat-containing protein 15-like n=1 Tax=Culicoides brevitarsis TaxID=469753 RepID=UPI00307C4A70
MNYKLKFLLFSCFFASLTAEQNYECKEHLPFHDYGSCLINKFEPGRNSYNFFSNKNPKFINKVHFNASRYPELPSLIFHTFKNLTYLNVTSMGIDHIDPKNMGDASSLLDLHLSKNRIKELLDESFADAPNLESLYLSKNEIKTISKNSFKGLGELRILALDSNKIEVLDKDTFLYNAKLHRIDLGNNLLKEVDTLLFFPCKVLKELIINKNRLVSLTLVFEYNFLMKLIANQNKIVTLTLDADKVSRSQNTSTVIQAIENNIENFFVSDKYKVTALHLYKNKLKDFKPIWKLETLKSLSLSSNSIGYVNQSSFANMGKLEELYLSRTDLFFSDPDTFKALKRLKKLDIGYNNLRFIDFMDFRPLVSLEDLAIHANALTDLNVHSLKQSLPHLKRIFISGNNFLCDVLARIVEHLERVGIQPTGDFKTLSKVDASKIHCNPKQDNDAEMVNSREQMLYFEGKISTMMKEMERRINEQFTEISEKFCRLEHLLSQTTTTSKGDTRNLKSTAESSLCSDF